MVNLIKLEMTSLPQNVGVARVAVAAFAAQMDFTLHEIDEIKLCVSEAVTNSVVHGYPETPGMVIVKAEARNGALFVTVEDSGKGFDVTQVDLSRTAADDEADRMGLGFIFMKSFSDDISIWSEQGKGTRVTMVKSPKKSEAMPARDGIDGT